LDIVENYNMHGIKILNRPVLFACIHILSENIHMLPSILEMK